MMMILAMTLIAFSQTHPSSSDKPSQPEVLQQGQGRAADDGPMMDDVTLKKSKTLDEYEMSPTGMTAETAIKPSTAPMVVKDVETLLDHYNQYQGKRVSVVGEVKNTAKDSFVLESGGIFNDKIEVQRGAVKNVTIANDNQVLVTGKVQGDKKDRFIVADQIFVRR